MHEVRPINQPQLGVLAAWCSDGESSNTAATAESLNGDPIRGRNNFKSEESKSLNEAIFSSLNT